MVLDKMKDILVEQLECDPEDITMESLLVDDLGADSLDAIDIVMSVEDTFKVEVPDEIIEKIETVGDIVNYIEDHIRFAFFTICQFLSKIAAKSVDFLSKLPCLN